MDFFSVKHSALFVAGLSVCIGIYIWQQSGTKDTQKTNAEAIPVCGVSTTVYTRSTENGKFINLLPGWGAYTYRTSLQSDSAQLYFDQGMMMYYSYHMKEALASFKETVRLEPNSALGYWGQALAMGPYYNAAHSYRIPDGILGILQQMNQHSDLATSREKALINAMNSRYPANPSAAQKTLDADYAFELKKILTLYPDDIDLKTLYIDAIMLQHAWDFWETDGTIKPWTGEVTALCEEVLKTSPEHPAALHYYIHLTEASPRPEVALSNGDALVALFPGVPHMVHMASHTYQRNGQYAKGVNVNNLADSVLTDYASRAKNLSLNTHSPHYFAVQTYCALTGGMYAIALSSAYRCRKSVAPSKENTYDQYLYMLPTLTRVRMGRWDEILDDPIQPAEEWSYARLLHHFSRGLAFAHMKNLTKASTELEMLQKNAADPLLLKRRIPFNAPVQMAGIAEHILNATILFTGKKREEAIESLQKAIALEDQLIYTEPHDWPLPARQFMGRYLLQMRKPELAEKIYKEDLALNPQNGWSLLGLHQAAQMQREKQDLALLKKRYQEAFKDADDLPPGSVY